MPLTVAIGKSAAPNGQDACTEAVDQALSALGSEKPRLAFIFVSEKHQSATIVQGLNTRLRNIPLVGFSTREVFIAENDRSTTFAAVLLAGDTLQVSSTWRETYGANEKIERQGILPDVYQKNTNLFLIADDGDALGKRIHQTGNDARTYSILGAVPQGYSIGTSLTRGVQAEKDGLAELQIAGNINLSCGTSHGWHPIGKYFRITKTKGNALLELNHKTPAETFAELFGIPLQNWLSPPLNELVRIYPIGIETSSPGQFQFHSQKGIRADGVFDMVTSIPEGSTGHVMIASPTSCANAIHDAAKKAKEGMHEGEKPLFALVFADLAWKYMFDAQVKSIETVLGEALEGIPFTGGYTLGQLHPSISSDAELVTQHVQIILFSEQTVLVH